MIDLYEDVMPDQLYSYDGRTGCVMRHRSRATGTTIGIYKADQAGLDGSAGEWIAMCEEHGEQYAFPNLRHAQKNYAGAPWCNQCHPAGAPGVPAPPPPKLPGSPRIPYVSVSGQRNLLLNMQVYERLGSPPGLRVCWDADGERLIIEASGVDELDQADVYPVQTARRANGTTFHTGMVAAMAPLRQSGLAPGRYKPRIRQGQVFLKARYKVDDQADDQADKAETQD